MRMAFHLHTLGLVLSSVRVLFCQKAAAQPAWLGSLPGPPETCSSDLISRIQWGAATSAFQVWAAAPATPHPLNRTHAERVGSGGVQR